MEFSIFRGHLLIGVLLVAALTPEPFTAGQQAPELRLPPDATYTGAEASPGPVVFSHTTHVVFAEHRCVTCHPAPFSILQPTRRVSHEQMDAGQQCGICHDGTKASGVQDACEHCHQMEDAE